MYLGQTRVYARVTRVTVDPVFASCQRRVNILSNLS